MGLGRVKNQTLVYHHGDSFDRIAILVLNNDDSIFVLDGYNITMQVKDAVGGTAYVTLVSGGGGIDVTPAAGRIAFNASPAQMAGSPTLAPGKYVYDIQGDNGLRRRTYLKGTFWVDDEVTS